MAGQPAPTDIQMTITPYFLKSQEQRTFVPFVLDVKGALRQTRPCTCGWSTRLPSPTRRPRRSNIPGTTSTSFPAQLGSGKLNRVFMAAPGTYDLYIGMKERLPEKAPKNQTAKIGVLKQTTRTRFITARSTPVSPFITDKVNMLNAPISGDEPASARSSSAPRSSSRPPDLDFTKAEELSIFFQVYNPGLDQAAVLNILMYIEFHKKEGEAEKFFNKTNPQTVSAANLPPQFDPPSSRSRAALPSRWPASARVSIGCPSRSATRSRARF